MTGQTIAHYRILDKLGSGGMGEVYGAVDVRLGRTVAVKFLSERLASDKNAVDRFQLEGVFHGRAVNASKAFKALHPQHA